MDYAMKLLGVVAFVVALYIVGTTVGQLINVAIRSALGVI